MIAEMIPRKRHVDAIEAMRIIRVTHAGALLLFVGDGKLRRRMERFVAKVGLTESIRFLGHRSDIYSILAATDLLLSSGGTGRTAPGDP